MSSKKYLRLIAMAAVLALIVAACGDDADDTIEDDIGVVTINAGQQIQIRAHQAISGAEAELGEDQVRTIQLAIEHFGAIKGFTVNLGTPEDDTCSAEGGQAGAQAIVAQENVLAVIGTSCSGAAGAALPAYSAAGMVLFSGSNTNPRLTSNLQGTAGAAYLPGYFRTAHNDLFQGAAVAKYAYEELGARRAAAIHDGDPYTEGLSAAFRSAFETLGGEVPIFANGQGGPGVNMRDVLTEIANADVDLVFFPIFPQTGGPELITQKDEVAGLDDIIWFAADGLFGTGFLGIPETEGMYFSGPDLDFGANASVTGKTYTDVRNEYIQRFNVTPPYPFHAHAYDATIAVLTAIREASVLGSDGNLRIGRQALRDALTATSGLAGLIGPLTCDAFGDCGSQQIQIARHDSSSVTDPTQTPVVARYGRADLIGIITGGS